MNDVSETAGLSSQTPETKPVAPAPNPAFVNEKVFPLSRKIMAPPSNGGVEQEITEIKLRAPVGLDVFEIGGSVTKTIWARGGGSMHTEMDSERLKSWILRLSGQPLIVVGQIPARDIKLMYEWLADELSAVGN
jgi:hypothetical protein